MPGASPGSRSPPGCWPRSSSASNGPGTPMLDVRLFRNLRFSAASGAVTVAFFTLLGFIFLITQYFQFVRGYGPLSTGVHLLPVALAVGVGSVAGTQLAVRAGTKLVVAAGLVATAAFYGWVAAVTTATTSYGIIAVQMVVYGLGMGLTSAPATESIMGAVARREARHRVGGQRLDPPARRHPGRRGDRQCLRLPLRRTADQQPARGAAQPALGPGSSVGRRGIRGVRPGQRGRRTPPLAGPSISPPPTPSCTASASAAWWPGASRRPEPWPPRYSSPPSPRPSPPPPPRPGPRPGPGPLSSRGNPGRLVQVVQPESGFRFARLPESEARFRFGRSSWPLAAGAHTIR